MSTTRAQLLADVNAYLHRTDLPVDFLSVAADGQGFIDRANQRIGFDFRTPDNALQLTPFNSPYTLPTDFRELIRVQATGPAGPYALVSLSGDLQSATTVGSGFPGGYWLRGSQFSVSPTGTAALILEYYAALALGTTGSSTNALLDAYPQAYLYHCLLQASLFIQANDQAVNFSGLYADELRMANEAGQRRKQPISMTLPNAPPAVVAT